MAGGGIKVNNINLSGGADGATFIPSIDKDGFLSWSNNKGYTNPATVKVRGEDGATGAKLISQVLKGQDANGGNIYEQTFDDGTKATFTTPKGAQGEQGIQGPQGPKGEQGDIDIYHITITAGEGSITQVQYNSLKSDPNSFIVYNVSSTVQRVYRFAEINAEGTMYFAESVMGVVERYLQVNADLTYGTKEVYVETQSNKTTALSEASTDTQYASAKATYEYGQTIKAYVDSTLGTIETALAQIDTGTGV